MRSIRKVIVAGTASTLAILVTLGSGGAAWASPSPAPTAPAPSPTVTRIEIPMYAVPHTTTGGVQPNLVINGSCGNAFLYVSRLPQYVAAVHIDFGFYNLSSPAIWVTAHAGLQDISGGWGTAVASWNQAAPYASSWEKQTNLYSSHQVSGDYRITAYIHTTGVFFDCTSSPNLHTDLWLY